MSEAATRSGAAPLAGANHAAWAFAADAGSESALRHALGERDPQVWSGTVRTAANVLAGQTFDRPLLLFVDIDGVAYPRGALHALAEHCLPGTVVAAFGSADEAGVARTLNAGGVSAYLVKPLTVDEIARTAHHILTTEPPPRAPGRIIGVCGPGGTGASTLSAALVCCAAHAGHYICAVDLSRSTGALGWLLDLDPPPGLDALCDVAQAEPPSREMIRTVKATSDTSPRVSLVGYPYRAEPWPPPDPERLGEVLEVLKTEHHHVVIEGCESPEELEYYAPLADEWWVVADSTSAVSTARAERLCTRLRARPDTPPLRRLANAARRLAPHPPPPPLVAAPEEAVSVPWLRALRDTSDTGFGTRSLARPVARALQPWLDALGAGEQAVHA